MLKKKKKNKTNTSQSAEDKALDIFDQAEISDEDTSQASQNIEDDSEIQASADMEEDESVSSDEEDEAFASEDNESTPVEEKIDRRKGKRGPRQVYFDCVAFTTLLEDDEEQNLKQGDDGIVLDAIAVHMPMDEAFDREAGRKEAIAIFEKRYGVAPSKIHGPVYDHKGVFVQPRRTDTVSVRVAKSAEFISKRGTGVHLTPRGHKWNVLVNYTTNPALVYVFYQKLVDPNTVTADGAKIQKPTAKFIPIKNIENLQEIVKTPAPAQTAPAA